MHKYDEDRKKEKMLLERMQEQRASGVLLAGVNIDSDRVKWMLGLDFPVVLLTQQASDGETKINTVIHDNKKAVIDAVEFLVANGHERIAYISGPQEDYSSGALRLQGFREAVERFGLEIPCSGFMRRAWYFLQQYLPAVI